MRTLTVLFVLALTTPSFAQAPDCSGVKAGTAPCRVTSTPSPPTLTDMQKLQIENVSLRIQLASSRLAAAQAELNQSQQDGNKLLQSLQVAGYTLNLQTMTYDPIAGTTPK